MQEVGESLTCAGDVGQNRRRRKTGAGKEGKEKRQEGDGIEFEMEEEERWPRTRFLCVW